MFLFASVIVSKPYEFCLDLHDFAQVPHDIKSATMKRISAIRMKKKKTGELINHNKKDIALFRYGPNVFAIDEKCPHLGKKSDRLYS